MGLDSMENDLSKELISPPKHVLEMLVEAARRQQWEIQVRLVNCYERVLVQLGKLQSNCVNRGLCFLGGDKCICIT